jgi:putative flippase GtrA
MPPIRTLLSTLFKKNPERTLVQVFRYFVVSAASLAVDFGTLALFTEVAGFHYLVSAALSYLCGLVFNYFLSVAWVFNVRRVENRSIEFGVFAIIGVAGMGINELLMWLFVDIFGIYYLVSRVISAGIGYVWKYYARKLILFR